MKFDRLSDVEQYLVGSLFLYKGIPVEVMYANEHDDEYSLGLRTISGQRESFEVMTDDPGLSTESVPLGYANLDGRVVYVARIPRRQWKRGLSYRAVNYPEIFDDTQALHNMITGKYPSFEGALEAVETGLAQECAISRRFCIDRKTLYYRGRKVGKVVKRKPVLFAKYRYLSDELEEAM